MLLDYLHSRTDPDWAERAYTSDWHEQQQLFVRRHHAAFGASDTGSLRTPSESEFSDGISIYS